MTQVINSLTNRNKRNVDDFGVIISCFLVAISVAWTLA